MNSALERLRDERGSARTAVVSFLAGALVVAACGIAVLNTQSAPHPTGAPTAEQAVARGLESPKEAKAHGAEIAGQVYDYHRPCHDLSPIEWSYLAYYNKRIDEGWAARERALGLPVIHERGACGA